MLRKEREKRPTMAEVLDELQRHVRFRPASKRLSGSWCASARPSCR